MSLLEEIELDIILNRVKTQVRLASEELVSACLEMELRRERLRARAAAIRGAFLGARVRLRAAGRELRRALLDLEEDCQVKKELSAASSDGKDASAEEGDVAKNKKRRLSLRRERSPLRKRSPLRDHSHEVTVQESQPLWSDEEGPPRLEGARERAVHIYTGEQHADDDTGHTGQLL